METTEKLNKIYSLYMQGDYSQAKKYNDEILSLDANNIYAKRYENLLIQKVKSQIEPERKGPIPTVKGKSLKCPHCVSKIALSGLTQGQKDRIRNKDLDNLEIKCPYCHTSFMLQKKTVKSILGIKLGEQINYKQKTYRTVGYIEYNGKWYEGNYSGKTYYIEWILLGTDNSYLYFSEGYSIDDGEKKYEFDFSQKNIPEDPMAVDFQNKKFTYSGTPIHMKEFSKVKVKSAYGENAKSFKIGEEIMLAPQKVNGKPYVYEQESSGNQTEVGIYLTDKVTENVARRYFNKATKKIIKEPQNFDYLSGMGQLIFWGIFGVFFFQHIIGLKAILYILGIIILGLFVYNISKGQSSSGSNWGMKVLLIGLFGPIFMLTIVQPLTNFIIEKKEQVHIEYLGMSKKSELNFPSGFDKNQKIISTTKYDYGGVKTYYQENSGIKFSVQSDEDVALIKKVIENTNNQFGNLSENEEKINELFKGNLYKLK